MSDLLRCSKCGKVLCASDLPENITSLDVARIFSKRHKRVLQDIRKIILTDERGKHNFVPSSYTSKQKKWQPCFNVDREGFRLLSTRYRARGASVNAGCLEIRNGKRVVKVYGAEPVEFVCDRCGEVNVF